LKSAPIQKGGEKVTDIKVGDWVDWAYEPNDPNGPYAKMIKGNRFKGSGQMNGDTINDRLIRYRKPPYRVVQIFHRPEQCCYEEGHTYIRVVMYQKPTYGGPKKKIRTFDSHLFKRVPSPRDKKK